MRTRGSVRFDPYFKVQRHERGAWIDVQRAYPSEEEARAAMPAGQRCRIMRISMKGREPCD